MLRLILTYLENLETWHILVGILIIVGLVLLAFFRNGLNIYIALFFVAQVFATSSDLRIAAPFTSLIPFFLAFPLSIILWSKTDRPRVGILAKFWLVLVICFTVRALFSNVGIEAGLWGAYYLAILCLGLLVGSLINSEAHSDSTIKWLVYGGIIALSIGFVDIAISGGGAYTQGRLTPFKVQANIWGPTSLVAFLNCLLYFRMTKKGLRKPWQMILMAFACLSLILSYSRGSVYSFVIFLIVYWLIGGIPRLKGTIVGVVIFVILLGIFAQSSSDVIRTEASGRLLIFKSYSRAKWTKHLIDTEVKPNPVFGVGFYESDLSRPGYRKRGDPHNSFLQVWIEQGTVGLFLISLLLLANALVALKIRRLNPPGSKNRILADFCLAGGLCLFLDGLTVPHLWTHHAVLGTEFAILTGVVSSLLRQVRDQIKASSYNANWGQELDYYQELTGYEDTLYS
jgi:hypothetical protein